MKQPLKKNLMKLMLGPGFFLCANQVFAATAICSGTIASSAFHQPDTYYLSVGGSKTIGLCSPDVQHFRISPAGCKTLIAMAEAAAAQGKSVIWYIDNAPTTECSSVVDWHKADTRYFGVTR